MITQWILSEKTLLIEVLLAGFFAICCLRAHQPVPGRAVSFADIFRLTGRLERLRRTRWQWFSMVGLMLVLRLQQQLPPILELIILMEFVLFVSLPACVPATGSVQRR